MTIIKVILFAIVGLIEGCTGELVKEAPSIAPQKNEVSEPIKKSDETGGSVEKNGPLKSVTKKDQATAIDPNVLYLLLTAELAGQRNQYAIALEGYLQAANKVRDPRITERAAKIAVFLQDDKKADKAVDLWLSQDAGNLDAQALGALNALLSGRKAESIEHLDALLKLDPAGFDDTFLDILKSLGKGERFDFLNSVLDGLAVKHPDKAVVYFVQSLLAMQAKDNELAGSKLKRALELQPAWDKALLAQAQLAMFNDDLNGAETLLREDVVKYPTDLRFKRMLAQVLLKSSKFEQAVIEYQGILKDHSDDGDSMFALALLHLQLQQDESAKVFLEKLVLRPEWSGQAGYYLGKLALKNNQLDKALVWFDSVTNCPFELDSGLSSVSILLGQRRFDEVNLRMDKLQRNFPDQSVRLLVTRAEIYNEQKQYSKAHKLLSDALIKTPDQKELLYTRSLVSEHLGDLVGMEVDLQRILQKYPDDVATLNALGYTLASKTKRLDEAEHYLKKAMELQPEMAVVIDSYGWLLFKKGRYSQAKEYLNRAYLKEPQAEIAGHLVEVLMKLNLKQEAKDVWSKGIKDAPNDEYLLELKKRFF